MQNIGGFFEKFKSKVARQIGDLVFITESIKKRTGIALEMKDISIKNGIMYLKLSSLQKNVVFIKKTQILKDLEGRTIKKILDIC